MDEVATHRCLLFPEDPTVCPFLAEREDTTLEVLRERLQKMCMSCEAFPLNLEQLSEEQRRVADVLMRLVAAAIWRGHKLTQFREMLEIRDEILDTLLHLSNMIEWALDPDEILYKGLVALTAGTSLGFNRGVALLASHQELIGVFALGPRDRDEAYRIWDEISHRKLTTLDLMHYAPEIYERERAKFEEVLKQFRFSLDDSPFRQAFASAAVCRVDPEMEIARPLREFYGQTTFWVLPLLSHLKRPLGAILLDNFVTGRDVSSDDLRAVHIFAKQISLALERGLAYAELQEKLHTLEEAHRQIQERQEEILRLKEDIAAGEMVLQLTHSVKNPIVAIGGLARQLTRKLEAESPYAKYTQAIMREAQRLEDLLKDFVKFVDARRASEREPVDVNHILTVLCQEKQALWKATRINCHLKLNADIPPIMANRRQLYNCLENLVNNACEAMPEGGDLFIETDVDRGQVIIKIADTGMGIPEEALSNLFKPFFTTKPTGSGLGLYTAKQIIDNLGGSINVVCERGNGCTVLVRIPPAKERDHGHHPGHR
ncbi:MAG: hypothetical protein D6723_14380 [Acidobacteria bacterium]|nr:MAG: hypothetical protein D6723_14380 [Acidobacteriota bacterium]